nr:hypothetical protein Q903MT_gene1595 [Picea sitchensis]
MHRYLSPSLYVWYLPVTPICAINRQGKFYHTLSPLPYPRSRVVSHAYLLSPSLFFFELTQLG